MVNSCKCKEEFGNIEALKTVMSKELEKWDCVEEAKSLEQSERLLGRC